MAYNPYLYDYNNYSYYQPQIPIVQQPMMPVVQQEQPQKPMPSNSYLIWVQGEAGAKAYPVARGTTVPLFDTEGDFLYLKSVDTNGIPLPLIKKALVDVEPPVQEQRTIPTPQQEIDMSKYVTKEKYDELEERVMELETRPDNYTTNFTGNTFNNNRRGKDENGNKHSL